MQIWSMIHQRIIVLAPILIIWIGTYNDGIEYTSVCHSSCQEITHFSYCRDYSEVRRELMLAKSEEYFTINVHVHSNINILYFSISNQQPRTEPIQINITSLQEEYIILRVWQLWVHGLEFHSCFQWSALHRSLMLTLLKKNSQDTERPKTQSVCKRRDHSAVKFWLCSLGYTQMIWACTPWRLMRFQSPESHFHLSIWAVFAGFNGKREKKNILIILICLLACKTQIFLSPALPTFKNITHV